MYYYNGEGMKKCLFFVLCFCFIYSVSASQKFKVTLDKCIDGDTARFFIKGESRTVRFLSINAPEIAHDDVLEEFYGDEASSYVCKRLKKASVIKLQYDPKSDIVDKYDRVLAWVFVDDVLLQSDLVRNGYAEVKYVYDDYLYSNDLKDLEVLARDEHLGMWSIDKEETTDYSNYIYVIIGSIFLCISAFIGRIISRIKVFFRLKKNV